MAVKGEIQPDLSRKIYFICCHHLFLSGGYALNTNDSDSREKTRKTKKKSQKKSGNLRWIITIFFVTIVVSSAISFLSSTILDGAGLVEAFIVLLLIVLIGVFFDIIGVAVISASEKPFHSMASKKVPGAVEALALLRNAEKVSGICNDVVGDICGVVSGSASAIIAVKALVSINSDTIAQLIMSATVAGVTIAGKAFGKNLAMQKTTQIVHIVSKMIYFIKSPFCRKRKQK